MLTSGGSSSGYARVSSRPNADSMVRATKDRVITRLLSHFQVMEYINGDTVHLISTTASSDEECESEDTTNLVLVVDSS